MNKSRKVRPVLVRGYAIYSRRARTLFGGFYYDRDEAIRAAYSTHEDFAVPVVMMRATDYRRLLKRKR